MTPEILTGAQLVSEIEAWLAKHPEVSRSRFSVAFQGGRSCYGQLRKQGQVGDRVAERARKLMAEKPDDLLRRVIPPAQPRAPRKRTGRDPALSNALRNQAVKAANLRKALERIEAGLPSAKANVAIRITQRRVEQQIAEQARQNDPLEQAKLALRRAGFVVYSLSIYGGPADVFHISGRGREEVSAQDLLALAEQCGRSSA